MARGGFISQNRGRQVSAALQGNLQQELEADYRLVERGVTVGVHATSKDIQRDLRSATTAARLGVRLARAWRLETYPRRGVSSVNAAALVWSNAPKVHDAFATGVRIRSKFGLFLAIPTDAAPKRGIDGKRINPTNFPEVSRGELRFVYRRGQPSLLVVDNQRVRGGKRGGYARAGKRAISRGETATVVMFIMVPEVRLRRRIDMARIVAKHSVRIDRRIAYEIDRQLAAKDRSS